MANARYNSYAQSLLDSSAPNLTTADIRAILVDTADYTFSQTHDNLDDVAVASRVGTTGALQSKTITNGTFDAADITISSVSGDGTEAIVIYVHTGTEANSTLLAYIDQGVTVTPNGGDITISWNASGIFKF